MFIAVPGRAETLECDQHRTIGRVGRVVGLLLRIVVQRVGKNMWPVMGEERCGFVESGSTTNDV